MKANNHIPSLRARIKQAEDALAANPDMWPGPKAGFKAEITRCKNRIAKLDAARNP